MIKIIAEEYQGTWVTKKLCEIDGREINPQRHEFNLPCLPAVGNSIEISGEVFTIGWVKFKKGSGSVHVGISYNSKA